MSTTYSFSAPAEVDTWTHFLAWAGATQGISHGLSALGFTAVTDAYSANGGTVSWANGATNSVLTNSNVIFPSTNLNLFGATCFPTTTGNTRAANATTNFNGTWSSGTAYTAGQVVTYTPASGGTQTYMCYASGGIGIAPAGVATSTTYWGAYWFEIWKTTSGSLTNFYVRLEYGIGVSAAYPEISLQFGTAANGTGGINGSGNYSLVEQLVLANGAYAGPFITYMSGDGANRLSVLMWAGVVNQNSNAWGFERSISGGTSGPTYSSQYVTWICNTNTNTSVHQNSLLVNISGASWTTGTGFNNTAIRLNGTGCASLQATAQSLIVSNASPCLPVFPYVGWVGNPMTIFVGLTSSDASEGVSITTTIYGSSGHTYLCSKISSFNAFGTSVAASYAIAIRYE